MTSADLTAREVEKNNSNKKKKKKDNIIKISKNSPLEVKRYAVQSFKVVVLIIFQKSIVYLETKRKESDINSIRC